MRIRHLKYTKDRVHYALDKKLLKKLGWNDDDVIEQTPSSHFILCLINKTLRNNEYNDYQKYKEALDIISEYNLKREKEYLSIKKKYKYPKKSRGFLIAMTKFNRGFLDEEDAKKGTLSKKVIKDRIKMINFRIDCLKCEKGNYKDKLKQLNSS